jgi:hypothetical protein
MNVKTTVALLVLVGLGATLLLLGVHLPGGLEPEQAPVITDHGTREVLASLKPDKLTRIEVRAPAGTTVIERRPDGTWGLPGNWRPRLPEVQGLVDLLSSLRSRFEPMPIFPTTDLDREFGLGKPAVIVNLKTADGEHVLAFGEKKAEGPTSNRFSRETYLRLDDRPEVLRLGPGLVAVLDRPRDHYQQRRLFPGSRVAKDGDSGEKVERLAGQSLRVEEKKSGGLHFGLLHTEDGWELQEPARDRLEERSRDALLAAVPDVWAEQFVAIAPSGAAGVVFRQPADLASTLTSLFWASPQGLLVQSGLAAPERTLKVTTDKGETITLLLGGQAVSRPRLEIQPPPPGMPPGIPLRARTVFDEYRYAKLEGNEQIFEIKADKLKDVFVSVDSLREPNVARFAVADARKLEVKHGSEEIVLSKDGDRWKLVKPFEADADRERVEELLNKVSALQARDKDVLDGAKPADYGLDRPAAVIRVTVEEDVKGSTPKTKKTRTLVVQVGKHDAAAKKLYVMAEGWPRINAVEDGLAALTNRTALAYRGKRVLDFSTADLAGIEVRHGEQTLALENGKSGWRLVKPVAADADSSKVDQLVGVLGKLEALEYVNESPKAEELQTQYGLDKSALAVKLTFKDGTKPPRTLQVGKARTGKPGYFACLPDTPDKPGAVFAIGNEVQAVLERDSLSYLPLRLWQMAPNEVAELRIRKAGQDEYRLVRAGDGWKVAGPFEAPALAPTAQRLATDLAAPQAETYKALEAKDLAPYGLDKPALSVTLLGKDGKEHALLLGNPVEKGSPSRFARLADGQAVFQVGQVIVRAADHAALDLLDPTLLKLDPRQIERVEVKSGAETVTMEHRGDDWRVTQSPGGAFPADAAVVASAQLAWTNLTADRFVAYGPKVEWAKYGLDKPSALLTLHLGKKAGEKDDSAHTVAVGNTVEGMEGGRYVRVDGGQGVAVVGPEAVSGLALNYLDLVNRTVLKLDAERVRLLQRHAGGTVFEVVKKDGWQITKPADERADERTMQDLLAELGELRARRIAAYPAKDLQAFGLDRPVALWTIRLEGDRAKEHIVKLGKVADTATGDRFALVDSGPAVAVLPGKLAAQLTAGPLAFRDRNLVRFAEADRLRLERGPRRAVFARADGSWKLAEPFPGDAEQDQLDEFLSALGRLRADELVAEKPSPEELKKYGLDRPELRWRVQAGDREVLDLQVGNAEAKGQRRHARLAGRDLVFLLDARLSARVLGEYRPRAVWSPPLDAFQVEALRFGYPSNGFVLEKGDGNWQVVGKPDVKVNAAAVNETLSALGSLKLSRYVVDRGANLGLFGLKTPALTLEVVTRTGKRVLHVGNPEGESKRRYACLADPERSDVFVLDEATCKNLFRDLAAFTRP